MITITYEMQSEETADHIWEGIQVLDYFYKANLKREEEG